MNTEKMEEAIQPTIDYLYSVSDDCPTEMAAAIGSLRQLINEVCVDGYCHISSQDIWDGIKGTYEADLDAKVREAEQRGVAWAIGVIDELHLLVANESWPLDREYKGIKNTLRDRFKVETGVDPAPSYPVHATLTQEAKS